MSTQMMIPSNAPAAIAQRVVERIDRKATIRAIEKAKAEFAKKQKDNLDELEAAKLDLAGHSYSLAVARVQAARAEYDRLSLSVTRGVEGANFGSLISDLVRDADLDPKIGIAVTQAKNAIDRRRASTANPENVKILIEARQEIHDLPRTSADPIGDIKRILSELKVTADLNPQPQEND